MNQIQSTLEHVQLGHPTTFRNLSIFPLQNPEAKPADYITLTEALKRETVEISEVSDHGQVPELLFDNHDDKPVLIVDGEELVGAKQNRVTNVTILAPAHARTIIPVSCVEAGRWDWSSSHFNVSERAHYSRGRAARHVNVAASMKATGTYGGNQGEVWDDISAKAARMSVHSRTEHKLLTGKYSLYFNGAVTDIARSDKYHSYDIAVGGNITLSESIVVGIGYRVLQYQHDTASDRVELEYAGPIFDLKFKID